MQKLWASEASAEVLAFGDGDGVLNVVSACDLSVMEGMQYHEQGAEFRKGRVH
jgi:hypothetical protein